jgi:hypothetical protein
MPKNNVVLSEGLAILPESLTLKKKKREKIS